jgi:hypothetical protein
MAIVRRRGREGVQTNRGVGIERRRKKRGKEKGEERRRINCYGESW